MAVVYKVWDAERNKKTSLALIDMEDGTLYETLVLKASEKLQVDGSHLVLESDGTEVDEDAVLRLLAKETFILLAKNEKWEPFDANESLSSTFTVKSSSSVASPLSLETEVREDIYFDDRVENNKERVAEVTWKNFPLPLHKLSKNCINECEKGNRKNKQAITEIVHAVVDSIREIKTDAPADAFKYVSLKIVDKFPTMFEDRDEDGCVIGSGNHSITCKLRERNNYLNRPHKRSLKNDLHTTPKQRKMFMSAKADSDLTDNSSSDECRNVLGCENWQPDSHEEDPGTLQDKETFLKKIVSENNSFEMTADVQNAFNQTYSIQRLFLNNAEAPNIDQIRDKYPILLTNKGIICHYLKLMGHDINNVKTAFNNKCDKILKFGMDQKIIALVPSAEEDKPLACIQVIAKFFKEDYTILLMSINKQEEWIFRTNSPFIVETTNSTNTNSNLAGERETTAQVSATYTIYIEKQKIEQFTTFMDAFQCIFASYYVFNMAYPKEAGCTMEFIQRYLLKINPDQGSKNKKKCTSSTLKIISLINKLRNMD